MLVSRKWRRCGVASRLSAQANVALSLAIWASQSCSVEAQTGETATRRDDAIKRAVAYLVAEVPSWRPENGCFSCHNNGDGARALLVAQTHGFDVPPASLADSVNWLRRPAVWERQAGDQPFKDGKLAAVQFAAAQTAAYHGGEAISDRSRQVSAEQLAALQEEDGSWQLEGGGVVGSPAAYGSTLATVVSRKALAGAQETTTAGATLAKADKWIRKQRPVNVAGAAAVLWGLADDPHEAAIACREHCLPLLGVGQSSSGGWGPFAGSTPEPFDTALALLALSDLPPKLAASDVDDMRLRGEQFLIEAQLKGGGWQETTRPAGGESYAQHISTTAWATLALLASREATQQEPSRAATEPK